MAIFETIDDDGSGCLSCKELCRALQTNAEFAALCSGSAEPKVLSPIAAGLIAQNLQVVRTLSSCGLDLDTDVFVSVLVLTSVHGLDCRAQVFDAEFGDNTNAISPDEFVMLCRRLAGPKQLERLHVHMTGDRPGSAPAGTKAKKAAPKAKRGFFGFISSSASSAVGSGMGGASTASKAESRLLALQSMLRLDVVDRLEELLLVHGSGCADGSGGSGGGGSSSGSGMGGSAAEALPATSTMTSGLREGLEQVMSAARRLADSVSEERNQGSNSNRSRLLRSGDWSGGSSSSSSLTTMDEALELQMIRKELVETKLALAEALNARDVAEHALRVMMRDSGGGGRGQRVRSRSVGSC